MMHGPMNVKVTKQITIYRKWLIQRGHVCNHCTEKKSVAREYKRIKASRIEYIAFVNCTSFSIGPIKENLNC